ncbi:MAG: SUMF1/EgtB/PvdO family nonheme iron enzyme [Pseudomonadota bacterium]|nr:SUMF1/EgtB/PvdO family nonheme iron enzyme [Pseudomonadota bacterium]
MSRVFLIQDARGEHRAGETDMPLALGGSEQGDVLLPGVPDGSVIAYIALADGHAYLQPADPSYPLFHNHQRVVDSTWLKSGDQVQIGEAVLHWTVKGDQVFISLGQRSAQPPLAPPNDPPPLSEPTAGDAPAPAETSPSGHGHRKLRRLFAILFTVLVLIAAFVLLATPMAVRITPEPASRSISGFPPPLSLGGRLLALPGHYRLHATLEGYRALQKPLEVAMGGFQEFSFQMEELPGRVSVQIDPAVPFRLFVDDEPVATSAGSVAEIDRGVHQLRVETERYLPEQIQLDVAGLGKAQKLALTLRPAWADVHISSQPPGALLRLDDQSVGTTPLDVQILQGPHTLILSMTAHKPVTLQQRITAGSALLLEDIRLPPADGRLVLQSTPPGATISVDGDFHGTTPATLTLSSAQEHDVQLTKPGYRTTAKGVQLLPDEERELSVTLPPQYATLFISAQPADASLTVDGKAAGEATQRLRLTTRSHTLEFRKPGYVTQRVTVNPRAGVSQNLDVILKTDAQAKADATPDTLTSAAGQVMRLIRPAAAFRMGASRREAGRRANESRRLVQLTRPFYLSVKEVSNGQFRRFRASHSSGAAEGAGLDGADQPVVRVSWDDAARYCNWLSQKDGLAEAYQEKGGHMVALKPATTGYRLPSEAEWVYVARVLGRQSPARYPWSGSYPPTTAVANFADARISDSLADVVPGYDDGHRGSAAVGSFAASPAGFYDLGGNVAEWTNDFYAVYPGEAERLVKNPSGPASGEHHVVRDSSWRRGNITELRLSYRDYSREPRSDLGFRIARYAE